MHLFMRISYGTAALIIVTFFIAGTILSLALFALCYCLVYKKTSLRNRIEMKHEQKPSSSRPDDQNENIQLENVRVETINENSKRRESAARKMELELVINKRKSSMVIKKSYPVLDLSHVEAKYNKTLSRSDPRFTNYLKKSPRSFLGYESSSGGSINNS
jgi:hypothetical protein